MAEVERATSAGPCPLLDPVECRLADQAIERRPARDLKDDATALGAERIDAMPGRVDAGNPPGPGVLGLPVGDREGQPETDRRLNPTAQAAADQRVRRRDRARRQSRPCIHHRRVRLVVLGTQSTAWGCDAAHPRARPPWSAMSGWSTLR